MAPAQRRILLNILHDAQEKHGYLPESALKQISIEENIPLARVYAVASFYAMLKTRPQGKHVLDLCGSPSCVLNRGTAIEKFLEKELKIRVGETAPDGQISLYKTSCIGCCDEAPAALVDGLPCTKLTRRKIRQVLAKLRRNNAKNKKNRTKTRVRLGRSMTASRTKTKARARKARAASHARLRKTKKK